MDRVKFAESLLALLACFKQCIAMMKLMLGLFFLYSYIAAAEPGFWPVQSEKVPEKVRVAAKSVYEVYLPSSVVQWNHLYEIPAVRQVTRERFHDDFKVLLINQELNLCEQQRIQKCYYSTGPVVAATVFAVENNQYISVTHSIEPFVDRLILRYGMHAPEILNLKIPAVIRSGHQYVGVYLKVSRIKKETVELLQKQLSRHPEAGFAEDFDGVVFTMEGFQSKEFLKIAKTVPTPGEKLYALGYPEATSSRKKFFNVPDATGKNLSVTMGQAIDNKEMVKRRFGGVEIEVADEVLRRYITFSGDGAMGMSGGPIVNQEGEVVGHTHSLFSLEKKLKTKESILDILIMGMNIQFLFE